MMVGVVNDWVGVLEWAVVIDFCSFSLPHLRFDNTPGTPTLSLAPEPEKLVQKDYLHCYRWHWHVPHSDHPILTALLRSGHIPRIWN